MVLTCVISFGATPLDRLGRPSRTWTLVQLEMSQQVIRPGLQAPAAPQQDTDLSPPPPPLPHAPPTTTPAPTAPIPPPAAHEFVASVRVRRQQATNSYIRNELGGGVGERRRPTWTVSSRPVVRGREPRPAPSLRESRNRRRRAGDGPLAAQQASGAASGEPEWRRPAEWCATSSSKMCEFVSHRQRTHTSATNSPLWAGGCRWVGGRVRVGGHGGCGGMGTAGSSPVTVARWWWLSWSGGWRGFVVDV